MSSILSDTNTQERYKNNNKRSITQSFKKKMKIKKSHGMKTGIKAIKVKLAANKMLSTKVRTT